jgi:hypothetical protein
MEIKGHLFPPLFQGFVKSVGYNKAAALLEGIPETRLFHKGLRSSVDHPAPDGRILGPGRNQSPAELYETICAITDYGSYAATWQDIAACPVIIGDFLNIKGLRNNRQITYQNKPAAHILPSLR